jgi:hypothetical protein
MRQHATAFKILTFVSMVLSIWLVSSTTAMGETAFNTNARTYTVRQTTGRDSNPGTNEKPFKSISKALSVIKSGDRVLVGEGRYPSFTISANGVRLESPNRNAIIDASGNQEYAIRIIGHHVTFKGFEVTGSTGGGIQVRDTHHINLIENFVHHNGSVGIYAWRSDHLKITGNESAFNGGGKGAAGISIHSPKNHGPKKSGYNIEVVGNFVHHNVMTSKGTEGWGIILDGVEHGGLRTWFDYTGYTLIKDNYAGQNGKGGFLSHYAQNANFIHNAARFNGIDAWTANGFEMGVRASINIGILDNRFLSDGGGSGTADYVIYIFQGSQGRLRGNSTQEKGDPSNDGIVVDASSALTFPEAPSLNHYGEYVQWVYPDGWLF